MGITPSAQQVHKAALFARRNAERFFLDAKLLLKAGSAAHAYGMLVLAEEEYGKAIVLHLYADGYFKNQEWLWLVTRKHEAKHAALGVIIFTRLLLFVLFGLNPMDRIKTHKQKLEKKHKSLVPTAFFSQRLRDALEDLSASVSTVADFLDELGQLAQLQEQREKCFYVDFQENGHPRNPLSKSLALERKHMKRVAVRLDACRTFLGSPKIGLKNRQQIVNLPKEMRAQIAVFEAYVFGKKGVFTILNWLKGPELKNISDIIREYSKDDVQLEKFKASLEEILKMIQQAERKQVPAQNMLT